jgi:hypothetical protein
MTNDPERSGKRHVAPRYSDPPSVLSERSWIACLIADNGA